MTVCIATINHKEKALVYASDRMVTSGYPPIEFEHPISKTIKITPYCVVLSAGNALLKAEICQEVTAKIAGKNFSIKDIATLIKESYQKRRLALAEEIFLKASGLDLETFWKKGLNILPVPLYGEIQKCIALFDYRIELIIAGVDTEAPSIYGLKNPGLLECFNSIGFYAIGSGSMHAFQSLIGTYEPNGNIEKTLYGTYKAKKDSEVAPGVGKDVDIGLINDAGCIDFTDKHDKIKVLEKFYEKTQKEAKILIEKADFNGIIRRGDGSKGENNAAK